MCFNRRKALLSQQNGCMVVSGHSTLNYGLSGILVYFTAEVWTLYFVCGAFYLQHHQHPCLINYQALVSGTKREMKLLTKGGTEDAGFISQLRCILI